MEASTNMSGMSMSMDTTTDQSLVFQPSSLNASLNASPAFTAAGGKLKLDSPTPPSSNNNKNTKDSNSSNTNTNTNNNNYSNIMDVATESWDVEDARLALRNAVQILSQRGLKLASKWASEQLIGLAPTSTAASSQKFDFRGKVEDSPISSLLNEAGNDLELYAKSILDLGEYHRAAAVLSSNPSVDTTMSSSSGGARVNARSVGKAQGGDLGIQPPRKNLTPYGIYLRSYALYMAGERRKEEEVLELRDPLERTTVINSYLTQLASELHAGYTSNTLDAFGLYIYGVVLKEIQKSPTSNPRSSPRNIIQYNGGVESPSTQSILIALAAFSTTTGASTFSESSGESASLPKSSL